MKLKDSSHVLLFLPHSLEVQLPWHSHRTLRRPLCVPKSSAAVLVGLGPWTAGFFTTGYPVTNDPTAREFTEQGFCSLCVLLGIQLSECNLEAAKKESNTGMVNIRSTQIK